METYALFEDGTADRVVFDFFSPDPKDDPVRLAFTDIEDIQVRNSAKNGCVAAYRILESLGYVQPGERYFLSCQYGDSKTGIKAQGASAGLAFALKFVQEVRRQELETPGGSVAATGAISTSSREAAVEGVDGINAKLEGALGRLEAGDKLLFPVDNDVEVEPEIRAQAAEQNVQLRAVSTVEQAVKAILPQGERPKRRRRAWVTAAVVVAFAVLAAILDFREGEPLDVEQVVAEATRLAEYGEYGKALELVEEYQESGLPADDRVDDLKDDLTRPLVISVELHRLQSGGDVRIEGGALPVETGDRIEMRAGALYRLSYTVSDSCYVYAHQINAEGQVLVLVGPEQWEKMRLPGVSYYLPASPDQWLQTDGGAVEQVAVIAVRRRGRDLEDAYGHAGRDGPAGKDPLTRQIKARTLRRSGNLPEGVTGVRTLGISLHAD